MMARKGRRPLAMRHVDKLRGSARAKQRLRAILKTLQGEWTIPQACTELGLCEARFHALRQQWLQEALVLLEPRPMGRPPREGTPTSAGGESVEQLQQRLALLERDLAVAEARREVAQVLGTPAAAGKKGLP